jgi:head-tail adaptor
MAAKASSIGTLRDRVQIQTRSTGVGAVTWTTAATVWAEVGSESSPAESVGAGAVRSRTVYVLRLRQRAVSPTDRLLWGGVTLQILGVRPLDRRYVEVRAVEAA